MVSIVLDFEMNIIPRKQRTVFPKLRSEIIEIGAVKLDEEHRITDRFSCYVKPQLAGISPHVTEITGINDNTVKDAEPLESALQKFIGWIGSEKVRIVSWSDSDLKQLKGECEEKAIFGGEMPKQFKRWMDFQRIYTRLVGLSRSFPLSLKNAIGSAEQNFEGQEHSALDDAENTAMLMQLAYDKEKFAERTKTVRETMRPKSGGTTLGDLFAGLLDEFKE